MSLPIPNLDDRRFQDIVDEARRLIASYCPEWTNLEPSDPGVTLIELFAWMSEMVMFRLNQVPDVFYTRMLDLMGVQPFPPQAARTDVTFLLAPGFTDEVTVPRGTLVSTAGAKPVVFATVEDLAVSQPTLVAARVGGADGTSTDVWDALHDEDSLVVVFVSRPTPGDAFYLGFAGSLAGGVIRLDVSAEIAGIGMDPADPPIRWEVWSEWGWLTVTVYDDDTGGLQRDGAVTLLVPCQHDPLSLGTTRAYWLRARLVPVLLDRPTFVSSPRVASLRVTSVGGTVAAEHSQSMPGEVLGISDGRPGQRYATRVAPVLPRRAGETVRTFTDGDPLDWQEVESFMASAPHDLHFCWDSAGGEIRFGPQIRYPDGAIRQLGAVPSVGADITLTEYRHGGGAIGNVGAQTLRVMRTPIAGVDRVTNVRRAYGGVDAESVDNVKQRGPMALSRGQQVITREDYERVALEIPSIARARCFPPATPGGPIRLLVVPARDAPPLPGDLDAFALSPDVLATLTEAIERRRVFGVEIEIGVPYFQGVTVAALLSARPGRPAGLIRERAAEAVTRYLDPVVGGRDGLGWPFGEELRDHAVFRLLDTIEGVDRVEEVVLFEYDLRTSVRLFSARSSLRIGPDALFLPAAPAVVVR